MKNKVERIVARLNRAIIRKALSLKESKDIEEVVMLDIPMYVFTKKRADNLARFIELCYKQSSVYSTVNNVSISVMGGKLQYYLHLQIFVNKAIGSYAYIQFRQI